MNSVINVNGIQRNRKVVLERKRYLQMKKCKEYYDYVMKQFK